MHLPAARRALRAKIDNRAPAMIRVLMNHATPRRMAAWNRGTTNPAGAAGAPRRSLPRSRSLRACRPTRSPRNPAVEALVRQYPRPSTAERRRERRARRAARALTPQREKRRSHRGPRPRREATQDARTNQEAPSPPQTTDKTRHQTRQHVGRAGAAASRCSVAEPPPPPPDARPASRAGLTPTKPAGISTQRKGSVARNHVGRQARWRRRCSDDRRGAPAAPT